MSGSHEKRTPDSTKSITATAPQPERIAYWSLVSQQRTAAVQFEAFDVRLDASVQAVRVSMGYRRSFDFDKSDEEGQDFAIVRADEDGYVVGLVADGVSQSFMGHLAASELGIEFFDFLWVGRRHPPDAKHTEKALRRFERSLETAVANYDVPGRVAPGVRELIETVRPVGSQAVFSAFIVHGPSASARIYKVGDASALIHTRRDGRIETTAVPADPRGRFSSTGREHLSLTVHDETEVETVLLKSDGAGGWGDDSSATLDVARFTQIANRLAAKDDVSFVAIQIERVGDEELVQPRPELRGVGSAEQEVSIGGLSLATSAGDYQLSKAPPARSPSPPRLAAVPSAQVWTGLGAVRDDVQVDADRTRGIGARARALIASPAFLIGLIAGLLVGGGVALLVSSPNGIGQWLALVWRGGAHASMPAAAPKTSPSSTPGSPK